MLVTVAHLATCLSGSGEESAYLSSHSLIICFLKIELVKTMSCLNSQ